MLALLVALLLAQPAPPCPACDEAPAGVAGRVLYERALRAEYDGRRDDAVREAKSCLEQDPDGRFADAARSLIARVQLAAPGPARDSGVGPRTELVISSTATGLYLGSLIAAAEETGEKATVALLMAGTAAGLGVSIFATSGRRVPDAMPQMLENGILYGTSTAALIYALANPQTFNAAPGIATGVAAGAALGLASSLYLNGGDSGAVTTGIIFGGGLPALVVGVIQGRDQNGSPAEWAALIGSTAGLFAGPLINARVHYSRGRWNLISLGGGVGALMGSGVATLLDAWQGTARGAFALTAAGGIAGLGLMALLTKDFDADEARPGSALLHLEDGKLSAGNAATALAPARFLDRPAATLGILDGRF